MPLIGNYANKVIAAYFTNKNYEMAVEQCTSMYIAQQQVFLSRNLLLLGPTAIHGRDDVVSIPLRGLSLVGLSSGAGEGSSP